MQKAMEISKKYGRGGSYNLGAMECEGFDPKRRNQPNERKLSSSSWNLPIKLSLKVES